MVLNKWVSRSKWNDVTCRQISIIICMLKTYIDIFIRIHYISTTFTVILHFNIVTRSYSSTFHHCHQILQFCISTFSQTFTVLHFNIVTNFYSSAFQHCHKLLQFCISTLSQTFTILHFNLVTDFYQFYISTILQTLTVKFCISTFSQTFTMLHFNILVNFYFSPFQHCHKLLQCCISTFS